MSLRGLAYSSFHLPMMVMLALFFFRLFPPFMRGCTNLPILSINVSPSWLYIHKLTQCLTEKQITSITKEEKKIARRQMSPRATWMMECAMQSGQTGAKHRTSTPPLFLSLFHSLSWACLVPWDVCETRFSANEQVNRILTKTPNRPITLLTASFVLL